MKPQGLELASEVASIDVAEAWAWQVCDACGLGEEQRYRLGLAVREAAANAVLHGNRCDLGKRVRLGWEQHGRSLVVTVGDEGDGFTPPPPDGALNLTSSGRGLTLIRHFVDSFSTVRRDDPPGTDVVLALNTEAADAS